MILLNTYFEILPIPLLILQGVKKCEIKFLRALVLKRSNISRISKTNLINLWHFQICCSSVHSTQRIRPNSSAEDCSTVLKFDLLVHYGPTEAAELWKSTSVQIQDGGRRPNFNTVFTRVYRYCVLLHHVGLYMYAIPVRTCKHRIKVWAPLVASWSFTVI